MTVEQAKQELKQAILETKSRQDLGYSVILAIEDFEFYVRQEERGKK